MELQNANNNDKFKKSELQHKGQTFQSKIKPKIIFALLKDIAQ